jgi:hypothetical protein
MENREILSDNEHNTEYSMLTEVFPFYAIIWSTSILSISYRFLEILYVKQSFEK